MLVQAALDGASRTDVQALGQQGRQEPPVWSQDSMVGWDDGPFSVSGRAGSGGGHSGVPRAVAVCDPGSDPTDGLAPPSVPPLGAAVASPPPHHHVANPTLSTLLLSSRPIHPSPTPPNPGERGSLTDRDPTPAMFRIRAEDRMCMSLQTRRGAAFPALRAGAWGAWAVPLQGARDTAPLPVP